MVNKIGKKCKKHKYQHIISKSAADRALTKSANDTRICAQCVQTEDQARDHPRLLCGSWFSHKDDMAGRNKGWILCVSWPDLTTDAVHKQFPESEETQKIHIQTHHQCMQSTDIRIDPEEEEEPET